MDWFLYDRDLHHDRVKSKALLIVTRVTEAFSEPCQTSKRERESFVKIANGCISDGAFCENR